MYTCTSLVVLRFIDEEEEVKKLTEARGCRQEYSIALSEQKSSKRRYLLPFCAYYRVVCEVRWLLFACLNYISIKVDSGTISKISK